MFAAAIGDVAAGAAGFAAAIGDVAAAIGGVCGGDRRCCGVVAAIGGDAAVFWCCGVTGCGGGGLWVVSFLSFVKEY